MEFGRKEDGEKDKVFTGGFIRLKKLYSKIYGVLSGINIGSKSKTMSLRGFAFRKAIKREISIQQLA